MQFYTYVWLVFKNSEWVPVYVGKGKEGRCMKHLKDNKSRIGAHLKKYPHTFMKFNTGSEQEALDLESALIAKFGRKDLGKGPLLNLTDGGEGATGLVISEEHKAAISAAQKGVPQGPLSEEHKAAISAAQKGVPHSKEHRAAISAARKGVPKSEEHKAALSAALTGTRSKPCTVDGITIYPSYNALREALGQGKNGSRSPNFRYI